MTDSNAELCEVKLKGVYPGKKVEITFDVKPIEKPCKPPETSKKPEPCNKPKTSNKPAPTQHSGLTQVVIAISLSLSLVVAVHYYLNIRAKIKINGPDFWIPKPHPYKPYCPKPAPCPYKPYCPKPKPDPCHQF